MVVPPDACPRRGDGDPIFGLQAMEALSIAFVAVMASAIIDLRRFRTMGAKAKVRAISTICVGGLVIAIQVLEHLTAR